MWQFPPNHSEQDIFNKWIQGYYSSGGNHGIPIWNVHVWKAKERRSPLQAHGFHCNVVENWRLNQSSHNSVLVDNHPLTSPICDGCLLPHRYFAEYSEVKYHCRWLFTVLSFMGGCKEEGMAKGGCLWKECGWSHQGIIAEKAKQEDKVFLQNLSQVWSQHGWLFSEPGKSTEYIWGGEYIGGGEGYVWWGLPGRQGVRCWGVHIDAHFWALWGLSSMVEIFLGYISVMCDILLNKTACVIFN